MEAPQKYAQLTRDVSALLEDGIGRELLSKLVEAPKSDHHLLLDKDISAFFSKYYQLKKRHQEAHLTCAVLALTKSGEWSTPWPVLRVPGYRFTQLPRTPRCVRRVCAWGRLVGRGLLPFSCHDSQRGLMLRCQGPLHCCPIRALTCTSLQKESRFSGSFLSADGLLYRSCHCLMCWGYPCTLLGQQLLPGHQVLGPSPYLEGTLQYLGGKSIEKVHLLAGKSTLLNGLLGALVLPSSNVPETARITRIIHTPLGPGDVPQLVYTTAAGEERCIAGEYGIRDCPFHSLAVLMPVL